jgi:hypothetical protein
MISRMGLLPGCPTGRNGGTSLPSRLMSLATPSLPLTPMLRAAATGSQNPCSPPKVRFPHSISEVLSMRTLGSTQQLRSTRHPPLLTVDRQLQTITRGLIQTLHLLTRVPGWLHSSNTCHRHDHSLHPTTILRLTDFLIRMVDGPRDMVLRVAVFIAQSTWSTTCVPTLSAQCSQLSLDNQLHVTYVSLLLSRIVMFLLDSSSFRLFFFDTFR